MPRTHADRHLVSEVRAALAFAADPTLAPGMQAYMKSAMPYYGVRAAPMRRLAKAYIDARPPSARETWEATVRVLFDEADHREERYVALVLAGHRSAREWQDAETLSLHRHLVEAGAWWDVVDQVATDLVGPILRAYPAEVGPTMRAWAVDDDLWVRRTAVISQVGAKDAVDLDLLADCLTPNPRTHRVLAAQGERLGPPRRGLPTPRLDPGVRGVPPRDVRPHPSRGHQAPRGVTPG